jgi:hypothetical protein
MPVASNVTLVVRDRDKANELVLGQVRNMQPMDVDFWMRHVEPHLKLQRATGDGEDAHWEWQKKFGLTFQEGIHGFVLTLKSDPDIPQGLMLLAEKDAPVLSPQNGHKLCYVDLLSVADWNRPVKRPRPLAPLKTYLARAGRYSGVGTALIGRALRLTEEKAHLPRGIVGLHSLPLAKNFYEHLGMTAFGVDRLYEDLEYFELAAQIGQSVLDNLRQQDQRLRKGSSREGRRSIVVNR